MKNQPTINPLELMHLLLAASKRHTDRLPDDIKIEGDILIFFEEQEWQYVGAMLKIYKKWPCGHGIYPNMSWHNLEVLCKALPNEVTYKDICKLVERGMKRALKLPFCGKGRFSNLILKNGKWYLYDPGKEK